MLGYCYIFIIKADLEKRMSLTGHRVHGLSEQVRRAVYTNCLWPGWFIWQTICNNKQPSARGLSPELELTMLPTAKNCCSWLTLSRTEVSSTRYSVGSWENRIPPSPQSSCCMCMYKNWWKIKLVKWQIQSRSGWGHKLHSKQIDIFSTSVQALICQKLCPTLWRYACHWWCFYGAKCSGETPQWSPWYSLGTRSSIS